MSTRDRDAMRIGLEIAELIRQGDESTEAEGQIMADALRILIDLGETSALAQILILRDGRDAAADEETRRWTEHHKQRQEAMEKASTIPCPQCHAAPQSPCTGPQGAPLATTTVRHHEARIRTATQGLTD